jgi:hypothetical protein
MRPSLLTLLPVLALSLPAAASDLGAFGWLMKPTGTATVGDDNILGTTFDLENDLGIDEELTVPGGFIRLGQGSGIGVEYMKIEAEGDNTITRDIQFKDLNFTARSKVLSEFNADLVHAYLRLGVPAQGFAIGAEAGGVFANIEATAAASGIGSASASARAPMPYAGGHLTLDISGFVIKGNVRYSKWDIDDIEVEYLDWEVSGRIEVKPFFVGGGYRSMDIQLADSGENYDVDLGFSGPVVYAGLVW